MQVIFKPETKREKQVVKQFGNVWKVFEILPKDVLIGPINADDPTDHWRWTSKNQVEELETCSNP